MNDRCAEYRYGDPVKFLHRSLKAIERTQSVAARPMKCNDAIGVAA